jgi:ABC-type phosphate transport system substrate-binding protein
MLQRLGWLCVSTVALLPYARLAAQDVSYRVVVNIANPIVRLSRDQVSRIFLRTITLWDNRQPVLPVDQTADSPVRRAFTRQIHQRTIASVQTWWQQQTFAGIGVAPPERGSDAEILGYIRRYPNAIGYVRAGVAIGADIKTIDVTP